MQARAPLWGANVGRILTQKISRPKSHSFTRAHNPPLRSTNTRLNASIEVHPAFAIYKLIRHSHSATGPNTSPSRPNQIHSHHGRTNHTTGPHLPPVHTYHRSRPTTGPSSMPNEASPNQITTRPDCFSPGQPAAIYIQDPCPQPHSINRGAGVQQWQTSLRAQAWKELSNNFRYL